MARSTTSDRVKMWLSRTEAANRVYTAWEQKYKCQQCEDFYNGQQWPDDIEKTAEKYTVNLVFSTVESFLPSLFFTRPQIEVDPRAGRTDDPGSMAAERAKLQKDTINTMLGDRSLRFKDEAEMALKEAFWRFGVLEVGYTADWIDNPNAGKPILKEEGEEGQDPAGPQTMLDENGRPVMESPYILESEGLYIKRIPAQTWRVSARNKNSLYACDWCGYYEYHYPEDLRRNKKYKNTSDLNPTTYVKREYAETDLSDDEETREKKRGMVKVWKIWDIRAQKRYVFPDGGDKFFLDGEPFDHLPFSDARFHKQGSGWYPIPPIYNWLSPQVELNESREMMRIHRRRFVRRYRVDPNLDDKEAAKLESSVDGTYIRAKEGQVEPIEDAQLGASVQFAIPASKDDLREVSGLGGEQRGIAEADTATQAGIIEARGQVRENYYRVIVADWLADIGYLALRTIHDLMALPFWIKISVDPLAPGADQETARVTALWQQITSADMGDLNCDIRVDASTLSPVAQEQERNIFFQGLAILSDPRFATLLMGSELLLRKALSYFKTFTEREIQEIKKALMLTVMAAAQAQGTPAGGGGAGGGLGGSAASAPAGADVGKQITRQLYGGVAKQGLI